MCKFDVARLSVCLCVYVCVCVHDTVYVCVHACTHTRVCDTVLHMIRGSALIYHLHHKNYL